MSREQLIGKAVATALEVVGNIGPDRMGAPTPCAGFDVRGLVNHLLFWGPSLNAAARDEPVPPPAAAESDVDLTAGDWAADLGAQLRDRAVAWGEPSAWTGTTTVGGPQRMPAEVIGAMVLGETVVHTWDLARATGQAPSWDEELLAFIHADLVVSAPVGRDMGLYGPEVPVPSDAPLIDRVLGLTGRTP
ncbi:TIGR03086 family protein [Saccharothrix sp. 6-C]|uniref:TIGR03086 family metal-binding protein n=1 Tax=Saccharothrix sp. 6-C TaxID=2781735 RepID=UPI0019173A90|nr:TIGR03086 family metal-binding protein [Saccharothrix sp. 6-C]QQQ76028.1 TIGR03086 family protein [Saccharothrix sp. 6-C]